MLTITAYVYLPFAHRTSSGLDFYHNPISVRGRTLHKKAKT